MKILCFTIYTLCVAIVTAVHLGPLETEIKIGEIDDTEHPHTDNEIRAANNVIGLLEYVRRLMPVGINMFLPVMEPYTKDEMAPVILDSERLQGQMDLTNLVASGAQQFTIHDIDLVHDAKNLEFNISVPEVVVDVDFEGTNLHLDDILVFNTSGSLHIVLTGLIVDGALCVDEVEQHYKVVGIEVRNSVDDVEVNVNGHIPEDIVDIVKDRLMTAVAKTASDELTQILSHFTVEQVKTFLEI